MARRGEGHDAKGAAKNVVESITRARTTAKILTGLGQVVSLLGDALQFTWSPDFSAIVVFLKVFTNLDVLGFLGPMPGIGLGTTKQTSNSKNNNNKKNAFFVFTKNKQIKRV